MVSTSEKFEETLSRARQNLTKARDEYESIERSGNVPDRIVQAFGELEREIDELDGEIDISEQDLELANTTARRVELLHEVLVVLRDRQARVIEEDIGRYRFWVDGISRALRKHNVDELGDERDTLDRYCSTMQQLADSGRHERVVDNERFTLATVDNRLRTVDRKLRDLLTPDAYANVCLGIYEDLLDEIHETIAAFSEANPDRTSHASELRTVKEHRTDATDALERGASEDAAFEARTALAGAQMLQYLVVRDLADQHVAERFAGIVREAELDVDCDVSDCERRGDAATLLADIADALGGEIELSKGDRLRRLLREHDGDVVRTANATDFDVPSILDHLEQMYSADQIEEITVEFST